MKPKQARIAILLALAFLPMAWAADLNVDCSGATPTYFTSINAALAALPSHHGPHTITISGTCKENVYLDGWTHVTLQSAPGQMATILSPSKTVHVVEVWTSTRIVLQNLIITGGARGVNAVFGSSVQILSSKIEANNTQALWVSGRSHAWVGGTASQPASLSNNQAGVMLIDSSTLWVSGYTNIDNNRNRGMNMNSGGQLEVWGTGNTINGNGWKSTTGSGISSAGGRMDLDGVQIANNYGPAIIADYQSAVALSNTTITGNAEGLQVLRDSLARLGATVPGKGPVTLISNGQTDLSCDVTSLVTGDLSGVGVVDCKRIDRELGPPRPGAILD